ncbi:signal transduction histidine kinase [Crossiella equi]|uniref:histidine kinase n=1 Tax=Crossiella equi TaxID=130796 RepID=A0ABS5ASS9_9PSEU|nr:histidine kinase [Crossiella equi]MBP2478735.1 signal transduction histidine kinase [Crossiella equi]
MNGKDLRMRLLVAASLVSLAITIPVTLFALPARLTLSWALVAVVPCAFAGMFAWWAAPNHPVSRRLLLLGGIMAVGLSTNYALYFGAPWQDWSPPTPLVWLGAVFNEALEVVMNILVVYLVALLPDGRFRHRYERVLLRPLWLLLPLPLLVSALGVPTTQLYLWSQKPFAWLHAVAAVMLLVRCQLARRGGAHQPWLRGVAVLITLGMLVRATALVARDWSPVTDTGLLYFLGRFLGVLPYSLIPVLVVVAALRSRLLGVDIVVPRPVVYGLLWVVIVCWYLATAITLGWTAGRYLPVGVVTLVTALAMLVFGPLRSRLNEVAARRVYGERLTGFELLVQFGTTLETAYDLPRLAPRLALALRDGLGLRWARVSLGPPDRQPVVCLAGELTADRPTRFSLRHGEEVLGMIEYGPKVDGRFTRKDHDLVESLARQTALAVHNANLATELAGQARELAASRTRIVQAQDTARRRIERQLHDGIQQELVALVAKLALARNQLKRDAEVAGATLGEIQDDTYRVIDELRELAHGIHPPVLTDQGLVAAVSSKARRLPIPVQLHCPDALRTARFSVDVEESAFFLVSEALANVLKHAQASSATIRFGLAGETLRVEVRDDGRGFTDGTGGLGITGMRDRAQTCGGDLTITSAPGRGTTVAARLPVSSGPDSRADTVGI